MFVVMSDTMSTEIPTILPMNRSGIVLHSLDQVETQTQKMLVFSDEFQVTKTSVHIAGRQFGGLPVRHAARKPFGQWVRP